MSEPVKRDEMAGIGKHSMEMFVDRMAAIMRDGDAGNEYPLWILEAITGAAQELERLRDGWVHAARVQGFSFTEIGEALGVSKQAVAKKYGDHPRV